jgi:Condensation domain
MSASTFVRSVGAAERWLFRHAERNPMQFTVVAEFDQHLDTDRLQRSLLTVQRRHPLLSTHVEDHPESRLGFYRSKKIAPIDFIVSRCEDGDWTPLVSAELARAFDRARAPLVRVVTAYAPKHTIMLLTFDHTVADGISALIILNDIVAALNGQPLQDLAVPASQEHRIDEALAGVEPFGDAELPKADARISTPCALRPIDDAPTRAQGIALSTLDTARLVQRCRTEHTTVHGAIATAASHVVGTDTQKEFLRVETLINFRSHINVVDDCAVYFGASRIGVAPRKMPFWHQARTLTTELAVARSPRGIVTTSRGLREAMPIDAEVDDAERVFTDLIPHDLVVSNLGVHPGIPDATIRPTAIWGPFVQTHLDGEHVVGAVTFQDRLRITACGYTLRPDFLERVQRELLAACTK